MTGRWGERLRAPENDNSAWPALKAVPVVTIDGPSGVGKGTAARRLAADLGWHFLDSGAMYRVAAIAAERAGIAPEDVSAVADAVARMQVQFATASDGQEAIYLADEDITDCVREEETGAKASIIAAQPAVRTALLSAQQAFRQQPGLVADGRDMGTVVFPEAPLKCFLDASAEERARRRWEQLSPALRPATITDLLADIVARDARDRNRSVAPLKAASDAVIIDTTCLDIDAVYRRITDLLQQRGLIRE